MHKTKVNWKKYLFEFISIFIAVISAFALNNWNDNRRDRNAETKILSEMSSGLLSDISDIENNIRGHNMGIDACKYWRRLINENERNVDTLSLYYLSLMRGYFPVQNRAGYETLKSKGLEIIKNDSLRLELLSLYEYDYYILKTLEENSYEMQFEENYSKEIKKMLSKNFQFDANGNIDNINIPIQLTKEEKLLFLVYLGEIEFNRNSMKKYYEDVKQKIIKIRGYIEKELKR